MTSVDAYLSEIVARAAAPTLAVRPRPRHRYENGRRPLDTLRAEAAPDPAEAGGEEWADPRGALTEAPEPTPSRPTEFEAAMPPGARRPGRSEPAAVDRPGPAPASRDVARPLAAPRPMRRARPAARRPAAGDTADTGTPPVAAPPRHADTGPAPVDDPFAADADLQETRPSPREAAPLTGLAARRRTPPREAVPATGPQGEVVQVTIGRIEVRATPETPAATGRDDGRASALAAYLREHAEARR